MVETLTEKNLELGEKIDGLQETVEELVSWSCDPLYWLFLDTNMRETWLI